MAVMVPMILARTGNNERILASVQSISAVGGVVGGLAMSAWGGPKRKVNGVLLGMTVESLLGPTIMGLARSLVGWAVGGFFVQAVIPIINGSNQAIWQAKVPPSMQGRVFATRRMIAQVAFPFAVLVAGPLADNVFEPAMQGTGVPVGHVRLAGRHGRWVRDEPDDGAAAAWLARSWGWAVTCSRQCATPRIFCPTSIRLSQQQKQSQNSNRPHPSRLDRRSGDFLVESK